MKPAGQCYTIPAGKHFVNTLADWMLAEYGLDKAMLSQTMVLLPSRRACRSLREAFLARSNGKPLLLPRIQPIGDGDEEYNAAYHAELMPGEPAISPLRRQLLLTRLVLAFQSKKTAQGQGRGYNLEQSAKLAQQLAQLLDDVARQGLSLDSLDDLVENEQLAVHWQQTQEFLSILSRQWPAILEAEGLSDIAAYRNHHMRATAEIWKQSPPEHPVIAVGSAASQPATLELLSVVASLPQGRVVLAALDQAMPEKLWDMLEETHPQYALRHVLGTLSCKRAEVRELYDPAPALVAQERIALLDAVFMPPAATMQWQQLSLPFEKAAQGMSLLTADTQLDEARMIAAALRRALETPGKTAALVTPDRTLARMVSAQLLRFGITIDDSAGKPLKDTPPASFMRLCVQMAASAAAPAPLLALLRHPLAAAGRLPSQCRLLSREMELQLLRGIRFTPGLDALQDSARQHAQPEVQALLRDFSQHARPLMEMLRSAKPVALPDILKAHIAFAEWLATTDNSEGAQRLWAGEAGNALAAFLAELCEHATTLEPVAPDAYGSLLETLLAGQVYRPRHGLHPRLHLLGPMEARMPQFDLMILGGLNEGVWPASPSADPWMSRPMRKQFGLPAPEYDIGMEAHDAYQFCAAPEVLLTRSLKVEGTPTVPSRWLVRMQTLLAGLAPEVLNSMQVDGFYRKALQRMDAPENLPLLQAPAPVPPLAARPRKMRVTSIDRWLRDPYAIYANYILNLKKLLPLDQEPDNAEFGTLVHKALENFAKRYPAALPADPLTELLSCGREAFSGYLDRPALACLWWPRFESVAQWIVERESERRTPGTAILAERKGIWELSVDGKPFTLTTSIDRIELDGAGNATIVDYKTGSVPQAKDVENGMANQLPLEALIIQHGELTPSLPRSLSAIALAEYWKLGGSADACKIHDMSKHAKAGINAWLDDTQERLIALVRRFDQLSEPYRAQDNPALVLSYNDYEHLTRRKEWEEA